jgi:hypothetical protein
MLSQVEKKKGDSQFWSGLMEGKNQFLKGAGSWPKTTLRLDFGMTSGLLIN